MIGATISHYKITAKLGEGGMGVVYKAQDTRLKRVVALKFLATSALGDEDQKARFLREAQSAALLDHPNIAAVHDIGEQDGHTFMAIAFVDGPELAAKIRERPLKLDEALGIAIQICEGLKEAHEKGVTHRDIKPSNIMLTEKGRVKITDFGLAHLAGRSKLTKSGTSLGTPAYMSPEQALGEPTDRRSDIWGVGVVLYEMIAGKLPFDHEHEQAIVYSIINEPPEPLTAVRTGLPTELDRVISKALAKKPEERYQHVDDFLVDLRRLRKSAAAEAKPTTIRSESVAAAANPAVTSQPVVEQQTDGTSSGLHTPSPYAVPTWKTWLPWVLFAASTIAFLTVAMGPLSDRSTEERPLRRFSIQPSGGVQTGEFHTKYVSISPNGRFIAFVGRGSDQLWVQDLEQDEPRVITGGERIVHPFWSPDSQSILFVSGDELKKVAVQGGPVTRICEIDENLYGGTVSPDGRSIVISTGNPPLLHEVPFGGGSLQRLQREEERQQLIAEKGLTFGFWSPQFLPPDAGHALVFTWTFPAGDRAVQNLVTGDVAVLGSGFNSVYSPSGHLLYQKGNDVWALPFSVGDLQARGEPFLVRQSAVTPSVSGGGTLVYQEHISQPMQLILRNRNGQPLGGAGEPQSIISDRPIRISPDGLRAAYELADTGGVSEIWMTDLKRGTSRPATSSPVNDYSASWSPDGRRLAFSSNPDGEYDIYLKDPEQTGEPHKISADPDREVVNDWSPDGRYILYRRNQVETGADLWYLEQGSDASWTSHRFLETESSETWGRFSPDGRYVAYQSTASGRSEVYVRGFPDGPRNIQVSTRGARSPRWNADGGGLFYLEENKIVAVPVSTEPEFSLGRATPFFEFQGASPGAWDVFPDGQRFLLVEPFGDPPEPSIRVVQNWYEEFRGREQ